MNHRNPFSPPRPLFDSMSDTDVFAAAGEAHESVIRPAQEGVAREVTIAEAAARALVAASECVEALTARIADFEAQLTPQEELALCVIGGPSGETFFPTSLEAVDPDKVVFRGEDRDGRPFLLVQHVSQLNFALRAAKVAPHEEPRRIGFHHPLDEG